MRRFGQMSRKHAHTNVKLEEMHNLASVTDLSTCTKRNFLQTLLQKDANVGRICREDLLIHVPIERCYLQEYHDYLTARWLIPNRTAFLDYGTFPISKRAHRAGRVSLTAITSAATTSTLLSSPHQPHCLIRRHWRCGILVKEI